MRLSDAVSPAEEIVVPFANDEKLTVMYRPTSYTPNELDKMQAEAAEKGKSKRGMKSLVASMRAMIVSWDLTEDDGSPISLEAPAPLLSNGEEQRDGNGDVTTEPDPMMDVPINVYTEIMKAANRAQQVGEA